MIVAMADLSRAADLADVDPPSDSRRTDAVGTYVRGLTGVRALDSEEPVKVAALVPDAANVDYWTKMAEFEREVGWSLLDVSWFVEYLDPLNSLMVAGGGFDDRRLGQAMGEPRDGLWRAGPDEDKPASTGARTAARPFGQSLRVVLDDNRLVVGRNTPLVKDATDGGGRTLADNSAMRALAAAMDDANAYSALFNASGIHKLDSRFAVKEVPNNVDRALPRPFDGVAAGLGNDAGVPTVVLAYAHHNRQDAEINAAALRRLIQNGLSLETGTPWNQTFVIRDIRANDSTVIALLRLRDGRHPQVVYDIINSRESLATHL
jgi:hypothetical protein